MRLDVEKHELVTNPFRRVARRPEPPSQGMRKDGVPVRDEHCISESLRDPSYRAVSFGLGGPAVGGFGVRARSDSIVNESRSTGVFGCLRYAGGELVAGADAGAFFLSPRR